MHSIQLYLPRFMNKYQRTNIYIKLYIVNLKKRTFEDNAFFDFNEKSSAHTWPSNRWKMEGKIRDCKMKIVRIL